MARTVPETVTIRSAAQTLDVHENTIRNYLNKNLLGYVRRPSGQRKVIKQDLERLCHEMFAGPPIDADDFDEALPWSEDTVGTETVAYFEE